ncbi:hypothetical protein ACHHYP_15150 [Achlya hypogyna]|uniref:Uncharacterized protein n=1 Tax=Achlya hypogyna TaxID=1202772 RepID=A0A1V9YBH7_ACHHY|nr:hypothetical protein ACHHYP_15150 [Achlya hypogyna]
MCAASCVFQMPELLCEMATFQHGTFNDLRQFLAFDASAWDATPFDRRLVVRMETMNTLLTPWLAAHSVRRLAALFEKLPQLAPLVLETAVYYKQTTLVEHLCTHWHGLAASRRAIDVAAWAGHLGLVELLHLRNFGGCSTLALDYAARGGHLEIVRFLHGHRSEGCTTEAMNWAANRGFLDVVQFLHFNRSEGCTKEALNWSAGNGRMDVVRFLHEHRSEGGTEYAMNMACYNGHLQMVVFLQENRTEGCNEWAMTWAATQRHLDIVKYLHKHRSEGCGGHTLNWVAANGDMPMATFLLAHGYGGSKVEALRHAARTGQLEMAAFLYEDGMNVQLALESAALHGHIPLLEFLAPKRLHGDWTPVLNAAAEGNHPHVIAYLSTLLDGSL